MTVLDVCRGLARHPVRRLLYEWNWKNALFTAVVRGFVFFATNLVDGWSSAGRAFVVDAAFRTTLSGIYAAVTQARVGLNRGEWHSSSSSGSCRPPANHRVFGALGRRHA